MLASLTTEHFEKSWLVYDYDDNGEADQYYLPRKNASKEEHREAVEAWIDALHLWVHKPTDWYYEATGNRN